jgi:hypothetical protein
MLEKLELTHRKGLSKETEPEAEATNLLLLLLSFFVVA